MQSLLTNFSETHQILAYLFIFLVVLIEGEIIIFLAGALSHGGYLNVFGVLLIALIAAIVHDLFYWIIGKKLFQNNKKKILFIDLERAASFLKNFKEREGFFIFVSKFCLGLNKTILIITGYLGLSLKRLLSFSLPACFIWTGLLVLMGYIFASETEIFKKDLRTAGLLLSGFIIVIIGVEYLIKRKLKTFYPNNKKDEV